MGRKVLGIVMVLVVFAMVVDTAQACRRRHCCCCCINQTIIVQEKQEYGSFVFEVTDFIANPEGIAVRPNADQFSIKLEGDEAVIATFAGEKIKLTVSCTVRIPHEFYEALEKTANAAVYRKAVNVVLEAQLDDEGEAKFDAQKIRDAVHKELKRIRFWDQPALFGIEEFDVKIDGVARVGSFIFEAENHMVLPGKVEQGE